MKPVYINDIEIEVVKTVKLLALNISSDLKVVHYQIFLKFINFQKLLKILSMALPKYIQNFKQKSEL